MFQLFGQHNGLAIELGVEESADQVAYLLNSRGILFEDLPYQWSRFGKAIRAEQRARIQVTKFRGSISRAGQRIKDKNRGSDLLLLHQGARISDGDHLVGGIFRIGPLVPLAGIGGGSLGQLCKLEEGRSSLFSVTYLGRELAQSHNVSLGTFERHNLLQNCECVRLASLFGELF